MIFHSLFQSNGMVIGIVDKVANPSNLREKCTPYYLLEKKVWNDQLLSRNLSTIHFYLIFKFYKLMQH